MWSVYIVRCRDRSLYTGISNDVVKRFGVHEAGTAKSAKYLRSKRPLKLVYTVELGSKSAAARAEVLIKKLSKSKKELIVSGKLSLPDVGI